MCITRFWLHKRKQNITLIEQVIHALEVVLKQNYFRYNNRIYLPVKGIGMGSHISSTIAEIYLQYMEEHIIKQAMENKRILYYKRYMDDLLVVYDRSKTEADLDRPMDSTVCY
jgi:hypothetical protein